MTFSYSLSACCQNGLTFNVTTNDVLPSLNKFACIQTIQYSGCAQVIIYNSSYQEYVYQSVSPYVFDSCDGCYSFCNCSPSCNTCVEYELVNSGSEVTVYFTDCNGYPRQFVLGDTATDYVCAKQGSVTSIDGVTITSGGTCTFAPFSTICGKFSGTSAPEGVTIQYEDCFTGTNVSNKVLTVQYGSSLEIAYCASVQGNIIEGSLVSDGGFIAFCDCEVVPSTPTPTPSITSTFTPTPTNTPSNTTSPTVTPTNTITQTVTRSSTTPTPTPTTDPTFDIYLLQTCCGNIKFRFTNIPGTLLVGQIYNISGPYINECAEVITYQDEGTIYPSAGSTFTQIELCSDVSCTCPTPTPTPTPQCLCVNYNVFNGGIDGYFSYTDCDNKFINVFIGEGETYTFCACLNSLILPETFSSFLIGDCIPVSPTNQPTPTPTPSNLPPILPCSVSNYCLNTYFDPLEIYNGEYYSAGTYNSRTYFTGTTGVYIFYNTGTTSWCLSTVVGGNCLLRGSTPCNGSCPDFNSTYFTSGVCLTTTTTTSGCEIFDFEGYFDCAPTGITPTLSATMTPTPTMTMTPSSTNYCFSYTGDVSFSSYTSTTTTSTTTTTTINRDLLVTGEENYTIISTLFLSPGQCFWFRLCDSLVDYYIQPSDLFDDVNLVINRIYDMDINDVRYCYTFLGAITASPNAFTTEINTNYVNCATCISNL